MSDHPEAGNNGDPSSLAGNVPVGISAVAERIVSLVEAGEPLFKNLTDVLAGTDGTSEEQVALFEVSVAAQQKRFLHDTIEITRGEILPGLRRLSDYEVPISQRDAGDISEAESVWSRYVDQARYEREPEEVHSALRRAQNNAVDYGDGPLRRLRHHKVEAGDAYFLGKRVMSSLAERLAEGKYHTDTAERGRQAMDGNEDDDEPTDASQFTNVNPLLYELGTLKDMTVDDLAEKLAAIVRSNPTVPYDELLGTTERLSLDAGRALEGYALRAEEVADAVGAGFNRINPDHVGYIRRVDEAEAANFRGLGRRISELVEAGSARDQQIENVRQGVGTISKVLEEALQPVS